jgi:hypothetical protein
MRCFLLFSLLSLIAGSSITLNTTLINHMGWVTATVTLDSAVSGVFLTVHTPALANVTPIAPQPYPAEAPWLASAAQKWITCASIPDCDKGLLTFSWNFSIVNSYADAIIHVFAGGLVHPTLLASSPPITFISPNAASRGHLSRLPDPSLMQVTWWSPSDGVSNNAALVWGTSPDKLTSIATPSATTYTRSDMCGAPATTMGWQEAHYWLSANITGLIPGSGALIYYSFGDAINGFSAPVAFTPPPASVNPPNYTTRILLLADNGVTEADGTIDHWDEADASLTVSHLRDLITEGLGWSLILHPGDVSYATGLLAKWATYTARWQGVWDKVPYFVGQGNHERDFPGSHNDPSYEGSSDSGGECGIVTNTIFPNSVDWRALSHGHVHVVMLNSELPVSEGSPQSIWLNQTLSAIDRTLTPWSIVAFHRPLYSVQSGGAGGSRDSHFAPLEPIFVYHKVDAVFVGHVHNALVTCPVNDSVCVAGAPVHICIGNAGQGITSIQKDVPSWVDFQQAAYGFSTLEANSTHMTVKLFADEGGAEWYAVNFTK